MEQLDRLRRLLPDHAAVWFEADWSKATPEQQDAARRHLDELDQQFEARKAVQK